MEKRLWILCCDIIDYAFKDIDDKKKKRYKHVFFEISNKEMGTFHGDYSGKDNKIRIFNLSRDDESTLCTSLHELAHHIDYVNRGTSDHSKEFYNVYKELIKAAIEMELITKEQILNLKRDASDTNKVKKIVEELNINKIDKYKKDKLIIKIKNSFDIKDKLKALGYGWNGTSKVWEKEILAIDKENENKKIESLTNQENIEIAPANEIKFDCYTYLLVSKSFEYKQQLKERGYYYDAKRKGWRKKINNKKINEELLYLNKMGLENISQIN
ncbi:hypothetical protein FDB15_18255 [Clostridium botulinum]|nr:hypothetical protein [Clostridium botulinum]NFI64768.1 hypothetical protein [Clostridium botulinum]NFJ45642.1 hypothetical protein [Clostridium botulinum]NFJ49231.1 hypothetical protein [Clostridium botulinum]NFK26929.1 hypothetical protein [Clostridium botulinum]